MLSKESPWRRLRFGRDISDWHAQIYPDRHLKVAASVFNNLTLNCKAQGALEITWKRTNKYLPRTHVIFPNGTLFLKKVTTNDAGSYTCVAKNYQRIIMALSTVEVRWRSCSSIQATVEALQVIISLTLMAKEAWLRSVCIVTWVTMEELAWQL